MECPIFTQFVYNLYIIRWYLSHCMHYTFIHVTHEVNNNEKAVTLITLHENVFVCVWAWVRFIFIIHWINSINIIHYIGEQVIQPKMPSVQPHRQINWMLNNWFKWPLLIFVVNFSTFNIIIKMKRRKKTITTTTNKQSEKFQPKMDEK